MNIKSILLVGLLSAAVQAVELGADKTLCASIAASALIIIGLLAYLKKV